jgi:hypothetical protein
MSAADVEEVDLRIERTRAYPAGVTALTAR